MVLGNSGKGLECYFVRKRLGAVFKVTTDRYFTVVVYHIAVEWDIGFLCGFVQ